MSGEVYDVSFAHASVSADQLTRSGAAGVICYVDATDTTDKVATRAEVEAWRAAGLAIGVVHERRANWRTWNSTAANWGADLLGVPPDRPIFYAVDSNTTHAEHAEIADTLGSMTGRPRALYGPSAAVEYVLDAGAAVAGWLTSATSWDPGPAPRAALRQLFGQSPIPGTDQNVVLSPEWGQWAPDGGTMPPQPSTMVTPADQGHPHHGEIWLAEGTTATWVDSPDQVKLYQYLGIGGPVAISGEWFDDLALLPTAASIRSKVATTVARA